MLINDPHPAMQLWRLVRQTTDDARCKFMKFQTAEIARFVARHALGLKSCTDGPKQRRCRKLRQGWARTNDLFEGPNFAVSVLTKSERSCGNNSS